MTDWGNVPFIDFMNAMDDYAQEKYLVSTDDLGIDADAQAESQEEGESPFELVDFKADKYGLKTIAQLKIEGTL